MLPQLGAILLQAELVGGVRSVFSRVIKTFAGFLGDHSYDLSLVTFFCHRLYMLTDEGAYVNTRHKAGSRMLNILQRDFSFGLSFSQ